ncbi:MAG: class II aldolase/adducin family protein [Myxococcota bacterium]
MANVESVKNKVSPEEWQTRVDLAAAYRLVAMYGWDDIVFTHITAKVPGAEGEEETFLINPYGQMFEEISASSLVKINIKGEKVMDSPFPINPAGFLIHSCVHEARTDAKCVMHTHSINGVAVSCQKDGVLPISQQSLYVLASLSYHDYEGVALQDAERPRLVADLSDSIFLMLRNHGLLTVAGSVADAFLAMYIFEAACMVQVRALAGGRELVPIPSEILAGAEQMKQAVTHGLGGMLAWPGLLRKLDRQSPGYEL